MYERAKTVYESRTEVLHQISATIPSHGQVIVASLLDGIFTIFVLLGIMIPVGVALRDAINPSIIVYGSAILFVVMYIVTTIWLRGVGLGNLLFDIRYVDLYTQKYITTADFRSYFFHAIWTGLKLSDIGAMIHFFRSSYVQTLAMEEMGIVFVVRGRYKKYRQENPINTQNAFSQTPSFKPNPDSKPE